MMGLETIKQMADDAGEKARMRGMEPLVFDHPDFVTMDHVHDSGGFPFIGSYEPDGWELRESHFVDSSGMGSVGEPAATQEQFMDVVKELVEEHRGRVGFAVVQAGQFQVYVGEFHRVPKSPPTRLHNPKGRDRA